MIALAGHPDAAPAARTRHAAVVARGEGIPAVCGADAIRIERGAKAFTADGTTVSRGRRRSRSTGSPATSTWASCRWRSPLLEKARAGRRRGAHGEDLEGVRAPDGPRGRAPSPARARQRRHARTSRPTPAIAARRASACAGPSTCSWARSASLAVRQMIFAETRGGGADRLRRPAAAAARRLRRDLRAPWTGSRSRCGCSIRRCTSSCPTRSPSPSRSPLGQGARRGRRSEQELGPGRRSNELHETNPMLGLRGVRLGIVKPGLYAMQVRAIVEAACRGQEGRRAIRASRS